MTALAAWCEGARHVQLWPRAAVWLYSARATDSAFTLGTVLVAGPENRGAQVYAQVYWSPANERSRRTLHRRHELVLALDDDDTCRAFDARLLQRLGAPPEATTQGVGIYPCGGGRYWWFTAGGGGRVPLFSRLLPMLADEEPAQGRLVEGVRDPLQARVLAWHTATV